MVFRLPDSIVSIAEHLRTYLGKHGISTTRGPRTSYSEHLTRSAPLTKALEKNASVGRAGLRTGWLVVGVLAVVLTGLLLFACVRALRSAVARQGGSVASISDQTAT